MEAKTTSKCIKKLTRKMLHLWKILLKKKNTKHFQNHTHTQKKNDQINYYQTVTENNMKKKKGFKKEK